jgi:hypothetical protein
MSGSDFDNGFYNPSGGGDQSVHAFSILGHKIGPELFAASEGKRHALGFFRMVREAVDVGGKLPPYYAFDTLKLICNSYAFLVVAVSRCGADFVKEFFGTNGVGISLDLKINDDYREIKIGAIISNLALKAKIDKSVIDGWSSMSDVDDFMQSAVRPAKASGDVLPRNVEGLCSILADVVPVGKGEVRLLFGIADGSVLRGRVFRTGDCSYAIQKRSDSDIKHPVDLTKVISVQLDGKVIFSAGGKGKRGK